MGQARGEERLRERAVEDAGQIDEARELEAWGLRYNRYVPERQPLREALTTLGNGYFATRGAAEEMSAGGPHYPGTYVAGVYNRLESEVANRLVESEDFVNWPNWLELSFRCDEGEWLDLARVDILEYEQQLDLRQGVLSRSVRFRDAQRRETLLESRRIVSMAQPHLAAIEWHLTPIDWEGTIELWSAIDGDIENRGVARYRELRGDHVEVEETGANGEDAVYLLSRAKQSRTLVAQSIRTRIVSMDPPLGVSRDTELRPKYAGQRLWVECRKKHPLRLEKVMALYCSRDPAISEPRIEACEAARRAPGFDELLSSHRKAWQRLWHRTDVRLPDERRDAQSILRLHIFHLLQTVSMNTIGRDVGVPARGLHGEAYRGHVFWDELFILPFLNLRIPELTRSLLLYRHRRLDQARYAAAQAGCEGAMFPWQSGSNGREESQTVHLNPASGRWIPDHTHRQRHVNGAIAYNVWQYYQTSGDIQFLSAYGAEILVEIARFWASLATFNDDRGRYEIRGVVGPDEFHTQYPGTDSLGLNNNAYTNLLAVWCIQTAQRALDLLAEARRTELFEALEVTPEHLDRWEQVSRKMFIPFHDDGIISQFEGWEDLEELDWNGLRERHGDIQRLDRVLEAEGDDPNRYQAAKQADVLMLFFLFSTEELKSLFDRLGYAFDPEQIPRNIDYYLERTSHGSTLSRVVHAWVLSRRDRARAWQLFSNALAADIDDIQGGTTSEGIHLGAMAGTVELIQRCYTGIELRDDVLWLNPLLPEEIDALELGLRYRRHWFTLRINRDEASVAFEWGCGTPARVGFRGEVYEMQQGEERRFLMEPRRS